MSGYTDYRQPSWDNNSSSFNENNASAPDFQGRSVFGFGNKPTLGKDTSTAINEWSHVAPDVSSNNEQQQQQQHWDAHNQNQLVGNISGPPSVHSDQFFDAVPHQPAWNAPTQNQQQSTGNSNQSAAHGNSNQLVEVPQNDKFFGSSNDSKWASHTTQTQQTAGSSSHQATTQNNQFFGASNTSQWAHNTAQTQQTAGSSSQPVAQNNQFFGTSNTSQWAPATTQTQTSWGNNQAPVTDQTFAQPQWNPPPPIQAPSQDQSGMPTIRLHDNPPAAPFVRLQDASNDDSIYAATTFEALNLREELLKGLYAMNFSKPSKIQEQALPALLKDPPENIICQSQSGNGKTIAFVLAMLQRVDVSIKAPQSICLAPTRELARQLHSVIVTMSRFLDVDAGLVVKEALIRNRPLTQQIIVGTPGTLLGALNRRNINTNQLRTFVLDEADNMLEQEGGLGEQSIRVKRCITSKNYQIMLFSATFSDRIIEFAEDFAPGAKKMLLRGEAQVTDKIKQMYMDCNNLEHKYEVLCRLYELLRVSQSIIFCKTRDTAAQISDRMTSQGHKVKYLHAGLTADERDKVIDEFRRGEFKVLISTNVVSRGIDITQVSLVINYDTPLTLTKEPDMDVYIHRVGRTGRFGRQGCSICFVHDAKTWNEISQIEGYLGQTITRIPTDDWEVAEQTFKDFLY